MSHYSNPTENAAIGTVDRELRQMRKRAARLKERSQKGLLTPQELVRAKREFIGIYRPLLREALGK